MDKSSSASLPVLPSVIAPLCLDRWTPAWACEENTFCWESENADGKGKSWRKVCKTAALCFAGWVQLPMCYIMTQCNAFHASWKSLFTQHISLSLSVCLCECVCWGAGVDLTLKACKANFAELLMLVRLLLIHPPDYPFLDEQRMILELFISIQIFT